MNADATGRGGLSPFYQVCWLGLAMVLTDLLALLWNVLFFVGPWLALSGALLLACLLFSRAALRRQRLRVDGR